MSWLFVFMNVYSLYYEFGAFFPHNTVCEMHNHVDGRDWSPLLIMQIGPSPDWLLSFVQYLHISVELNACCDVRAVALYHSNLLTLIIAN